MFILFLAQKPTDNRIRHITLDLTDEMSIKSAAQQILELDDQNHGTR